MRTRVVIQSRLNSSRLPGKAMMTIGGIPLIELVARRASRSGYEVIVATSVEPYDDRIAQHLERVGVPVMRGNLDDVLGRFVEATKDLEPTDRVVRLTGDNPCADADLVTELLDAMDASGHAYGRVDIDVVPEGLGAEGFWVSDLRRANESTADPYDHEHVTPWLRRTLGELLWAPQNNPGDPIAYRCTTDCLNDYDRVTRLFDGETDPVGVPYRTLLDRLVGRVDQAGPMAREVPGVAPRLTRVVMDVSTLGVGADGVRDASVVRETFAQAVNRGISHAFAVGADGVRVARAGIFPAVQQRIGVLVELPSLRELTAQNAELAVRAAVERCFAEIGARSLAGVFLQLDDATAADGAAWGALQEYVTSKNLAWAGVAGPASAISAAQLPGLGAVLLDAVESFGPAEGVVTFVRGTDADLGALPGAAVVPITGLSDLEQALRS